MKKRDVLIEVSSFLLLHAIQSPNSKIKPGMDISIAIPIKKWRWSVSQNGRYLYLEEIALCLKIVDGAVGIAGLTK